MKGIKQSLDCKMYNIDKRKWRKTMNFNRIVSKYENFS